MKEYILKRTAIDEEKETIKRTPTKRRKSRHSAAFCGPRPYA